MDDEELLRQAERVLAELDRSQGLSDEHADVLAALRIRIRGGPGESLEDLLKAAGSLKGKHSLDDPAPAPAKRSFEDVLGKAPKKPEWPGS